MGQLGEPSLPVTFLDSRFASWPHVPVDFSAGSNENAGPVAREPVTAWSVRAALAFRRTAKSLKGLLL